MRSYPDKVKEMNEALELYACEPWMIEQLRRNPEYPHWGPHEDYQWIRDTQDPDSPREYSDWGHFKRCFTVGKHPENTEDRSGGEIVNWYFSIDRSSHGCRDCDGSGSNPETKRLSDQWYNHLHPTGEGWEHHLLQDEVDALQAEGRLRELCEMNTLKGLEQVIQEGKIAREDAVRRWETRDKNLDIIREDGEVFNRAVFWRDFVPAEELNLTYRKGMGHDCINRCICVEVRAKRLGVWGSCRTCEGLGRIPTEEHGRLCLVLWVVNPSTGQNYGVEVLRIAQKDLPEVYELVLWCGRRLAEHLDLPKVKLPGSVKWSQPGSCLDEAPSHTHSWKSPVHFDSWKDMRAVRDLSGAKVSPEDDRYIHLGKSWDLNCYNEVIGISFNEEPSRGLCVWMAHPRKGCSRRITVDSFDEEDLPDIVAWAHEGRDRTLKRFSCVPKRVDA